MKVGLMTYLSIPLAIPFTILAKASSSGFSEPFWFTCIQHKIIIPFYIFHGLLQCQYKGQKLIFIQARVSVFAAQHRMTEYKSGYKKTRTYQIQNALLPIDKQLRVKMPLETIHLEMIFKRLVHCYHHNLILSDVFS